MLIIIVRIVILEFITSVKIVILTRYLNEPLLMHLKFYLQTKNLNIIIKVIPEYKQYLKRQLEHVTSRHGRSSPLKADEYCPQTLL